MQNKKNSFENEIKNILVTGGAGFIGSNFIELLLTTRNYNVVNIDLLTYAGNLSNLNWIGDKYPNYKFIKGDICDKELIEYIIIENKIDTIINFAAETHVDRSILESGQFIKTNINGTVNLLDASRNFKIKRYIQISTDEVYGSLSNEGLFTEENNIKPSSPYSSSKAAADIIALSYFHTYKTPVIVTRCSNNYGPKQFPEKLIPLIISNSLENKNIPVYGDGLNVRDWIYVKDHNIAVLEILENGESGEVYNIGASNEIKNIDIVKLILNKLNKPFDLITYVKDRPGHDRRYAIDSSKIQNLLNWTPKTEFKDGIELTIKWYLENQIWINEIKTGEYQNYYNLNYDNRS